MKITGFKPVSYNDLQRLLQTKYSEYRANNSEIDLAVAIGVGSAQTVRNAFRDDLQMVSDTILTKVMCGLGFNGFILWKDGERLYYVKGK